MIIALMDTVDEIKSRLEIYDIVSQYVSLKKAGKNFKGNCPFHQEKTPSFIVSPDKNMCYCFGCKQGGDVFEFIKLVERVDFKGAVELLADKLGIAVSSDPHYKEKKGKKDMMKNVYRAVTDFYKQQRCNNPKVKEYLSNRGLSDEIIDKFEIGYAPNSYESTYSHLLAKKFSRAEVIDAGIAVKKDIDKDKIYDRFRDRIIFPLYNTQGNIIAFTGRIIDKGEPKYLNSPESVLFKKGQFLYGLHLAKDAIRQKDELIIVEGNVDVVKSHQAGVENIVASSGTALTQEQVRMVKRYTKNIVFCFDADQAGFEASKRAIAEAIPFDVRLYLLPLPEECKDPDDFIKTHGDEKWQSYVDNKRYYMDYFVELAFKKWNPRELEGKKQICDFLFPFLAAIKSSVEKDHYAQVCAEKMHTDARFVLNDLKSHQSKIQKSEVNRENQPVQSVRYSSEEYLLGLILNHPEYFTEVEQIIDMEKYLDTKTERFYKYIQNVYNREELSTGDELILAFEREDQEYLSILSLFIEQKYQEIGKDIVKNEMIQIANKVNRENIRRHLTDSKDSDEFKKNLSEIKSVITKLSV